MTSSESAPTSPSPEGSEHPEGSERLVTLEQLAAALGPFQPPRDFDHGEEFLPAPPRPKPVFLKHGSHARRNRGRLYCLLALGVTCLVFWPLPFVQGLSHYIHPLAYLHWIGLGLIGLGLLNYFKHLIGTGRFVYLQQGEPLVGRVVHVGHLLEGTAEVPQFRIVAGVEFDHPLTGVRTYAVFSAEDAWPVSEFARHDCTLQSGEYVTLLSLPGKGLEGMKVYGFLGLDPELEYLTKDGRPLTGMSPFSAVMIALASGLVVLMLMGFFDLLMFSWPMSGDWKLPMLIALGSAVIGGALFLVWRAMNLARAAASVRTSAANTQKPAGPWGAILGGGLLGGLAGPLLFMILNSRLDGAPGKFESIEILQFWQTTHNFVISNYEVEYRKFLGGELKKRHVRYSQLERLGNASHGVLDIAQGRFGYAWMRGIYPILWIPAEGPARERLEDGTPLFSMTFSNLKDGDEQPMKILVFPAVVVDEDHLATCPEELVEPAAQRFRNEFPDLQRVLAAEVELHR